MKNYYVVCKGRRLGVFDKWIDCAEQVEYCASKFKGFEFMREVIEYVEENMPWDRSYLVDIKGQRERYEDYDEMLEKLRAIARIECNHRLMV